VLVVVPPFDRSRLLRTTVYAASGGSVQDVMPDDDYLTLTEASKLAGLKNSRSLYWAVQTGRLKTVTTAAGAHAVRLTTRAWLREYLDSQRRET